MDQWTARSINLLLGCALAKLRQGKKGVRYVWAGSGFFELLKTARGCACILKLAVIENVYRSKTWHRATYHGAISMKRMFVALLVLLASFSARAQQDCMRSLKVDAAKSVTFLSIGGDKLTTTMSCSAAEALRDKLFMTGEAIDPKLFDDANQLRSKIASGRQALSSSVAKLQSAKDRASREVVLKSIQTSLLSAAVAYGSVGCYLAKSPKLCTAALSSIVALYVALLNLPPGDDLVALANQAKSEIDQILPSLQAWEGQLDANVAQQSKLKYNTMFLEMCQSVEQQCK